MHGLTPFVKMSMVLLSWAGLVLQWGCGGQGGVIRETAAGIEALTEAHTRMVWVQDVNDKTDVFARGDRLRLMALDTRDGQGERVLLPGPANYSKPMIAPDGERVVFSDHEEGGFYAVNWDGTGLERLGDGLALTLWRDPEDGTQWVYAGTDPADTRAPSYRKLHRYPIDRPAAREPVRVDVPVGVDNFQLSADGRIAGGNFPWPDCGLLHLDENRFERLGRGCWTSLAPGHSLLFWIFDGSHRNLTLYDSIHDRSWNVRVDTAPGIDGHEAYHPRWSNHPRIIALTGPYTIRSGANHIRGGGPEVEIHLGRFREDFREIEQWFQVTRNAYANFFPDVWVKTALPAPEERAAAVVPRSEPAAVQADTVWPVQGDHLLLFWKNREADTSVTGFGDRTVRQAPAEPAGMARFGRYFEMDVRGGFFTLETDGAFLARAVYETRELTIEWYMVPAATVPPCGIILAFGEREADPNVALWLEEGDLFVQWRGLEEAVRMRCPPQTWERGRHVLLTAGGERMTLYIDGLPVESVPLPEGVLQAWSSRPLYVGGQPSGNFNWAGTMEGVAMHGRALTSPQARQQAEAYLYKMHARRPPRQVAVRARLTRATPVPSPEDIEPYTRGLVVNEYEVLEVQRGTLEDPVILVAHWVILDGRILEAAERAPQRVYSMTLEDYEERPELEGERLSMDSDRFDLRLFFDVDS